MMFFYKNSQYHPYKAVSARCCSRADTAFLNIIKRVRETNFS
ncbi:hypothetical protein AB79_5415 [Escherichia coli 6-175-07_S1_C3]|nr:hypothetical protein AB42_3995 [Escherichia coli 1-392-07_S1_C2]KEJ19581.1 hypothetical protein AB50_5377 [Escherichia coli 6-175-07_S1_C2]KEM46558.1 hypothetical protein AB79_5415 [Escherichia coli 6-175-07_S1_C3]